MGHAAGECSATQLKELITAMPVIFERALAVDQKETKKICECPVHKTKSRGQTYLDFNLKSNENPAKWILAEVALLLAF